MKPFKEKNTAIKIIINETGKYISTPFWWFLWLSLSFCQFFQIKSTLASHINLLNRKHMALMRVHNRGSQIPLSRLFFFSIPPSSPFLPFLRPDPDPTPFFYEIFDIFCLISEIGIMTYLLTTVSFDGPGSQHHT